VTAVPKNASTKSCIGYGSDAGTNDWTTPVRTNALNGSLSGSNAARKVYGSWSGNTNVGGETMNGSLNSSMGKAPLGSNCTFQPSIRDMCTDRRFPSDSSGPAMRRVACVTPTMR